MKYFICFTIKLYWLLIPANKRSNCLFKESCSNHVFRKAKEEGALKALRAFYFRYQNCRSGYSLIDMPDQIFLVSVRQIVFREDEIRKEILEK